AVDHLVERVALTPSVARAEVDRYCARPTQAAAYLTGALEIERLRDRWFAEGRGDLTAFHDTVASTGSLPIALAERAALPSPRVAAVRGRGSPGRRSAPTARA